MLAVRIVCVGRLKEKYLTEAAEEYRKRLSAFCSLEIVEIKELSRPENTSAATAAALLDQEAELVLRNIPPASTVVALCVEGGQMSSQEFAALIERAASEGKGRIVFVIGGSDGLSDRIKQRADVRLSMSRMTFPHHLARIMLLEQLYRAFSIISGGRYHK